MTDLFCFRVERVEVKDVRLPVQLQRAMAAEAEATREARAKVRTYIHLWSTYKEAMYQEKKITVCLLLPFDEDAVFLINRRLFILFYEVLERQHYSIKNNTEKCLSKKNIFKT